MKYIILFILLLTLLLAPHSEQYIQQPNESAGVDTVVGTANPSANYGTWYGCNTGEEDGSVDTGRCLIRFELPQNVIIVSATITLTQWGESSANDTIINVHRITQSWSELTATWNNQPGIDATPIGFRAFSANETNGEKVFALDTIIVQQMIDGVLPNYGFEFRASVELNNLYRFYSSAASVATQRPKLVLEYESGPTPTPTQPPTPTPLVSNFVIPSQHQGNLHIYIFFGQSNASGRGTGTACASSSDLVYNFGNDYRWGVLCEPSDGSTGQVDTVSIDSAGYSAALSFARTMREIHPDWSIGIINCAKGATFLNQWQRKLADDLLYGQCRKRAFAASAQGVISGFIFMQGESDAINLTDASLWADRFEELVNSVRQDFGNTPVVFSQLGNHSNDITYPYWNMVKAKQALVNLPCVNMIVADDLPMNGLHYYTAGYDVIGVRLAQAMPECEL
jgi:hypothetical protein